MRKQSKGICISFKKEEVLPAPSFILNLSSPTHPIALLEVGTDSTLTAVTEGWVTHIVC